MIFPNPAHEYIIINSHNIRETILGLVFYNLKGQVMMNTGKIENREAINISRLQSGLYIVEINKSNEKIYRRLVVR